MPLGMPTGIWWMPVASRPATYRTDHVFGLSEEQFAEFGLKWGLMGLIGLMLFIIWDLARKSKAGRFGSFVLFFVLAFGMLGFIVKNVLEWFLEF
jgi:hypothetical protein